jgi:hypothetical protein
VRVARRGVSKGTRSEVATVPGFRGTALANLDGVLFLCFSRNPLTREGIWYPKPGGGGDVYGHRVWHSLPALYSSRVPPRLHPGMRSAGVATGFRSRMAFPWWTSQPW